MDFRKEEAVSVQECHAWGSEICMGSWKQIKIPWKTTAEAGTVDDDAQALMRAV